MISQMDKNWVFGILYAKPHTAAATRQAQAAKMAEAHCTSTSDGIDLANIWTGPGQYDWSNTNPDNSNLTYDEVVDLSIAKAFEVFGIVVTTPTWALPPGATDNHRWPPDEQYAQAFIDACAEVASHFLGRIRYWSYWNEPNDPGWHSDDPAEYTRWLIRCYQGIKQGNPNALVSIGGLWPIRSERGAPAGDLAIAFIEAIRANGGQNYYDAVALHPYGPRYYQGDPFDIESVEAVRQNMVANNDGAKSIWCNEYGWAIGSGNDRVPDEATQAARLQQALGWLRFNHDYITMASYHTLADIPPGLQYGLCDGNLSPRPSFNRFKEMAPSLVVRPSLKSS